MYRGPVEDVTMSTAASLARVMRQRSLLVLLLSAVFATAYGRSPDDTELVAGLQGGGYVIVMRHVSSPRIPPDQSTRRFGQQPPERAQRGCTQRQRSALRR